MNSVAHLVEKRLDFVPTQKGRAGMAGRRELEIGHEHNHGKLEATGASARSDATHAKHVSHVDVAR